MGVFGNAYIKSNNLVAPDVESFSEAEQLIFLDCLGQYILEEYFTDEGCYR